MRVARCVLSGNIGGDAFLSFVYSSGCVRTLLMLTLLLCVRLSPAVAFAQNGRPTVTVRPARVQQPPVIDGLLNDAAWQGAARVTDFVQRRPLDREPATEP